MIPNPSLLFNRLHWQWGGRQVAAGQAVTLHWWMWQPWQLFYGQPSPCLPTLYQPVSELPHIQSGEQHFIRWQYWNNINFGKRRDLLSVTLTLQVSHTYTVELHHMIALQVKVTFWWKLCLHFISLKVKIIMSAWIKSKRLFIHRKNLNSST